MSGPGAGNGSGGLRRLLVFGLLQRRVLAGGLPGAAHYALSAGLVVLFAGSLWLQLDAFVLAPAGLGPGRGPASFALQLSLDLAGVAVVAGAAVLLVRRLAAPAGAAPGGAARLGLLGALLVLAVSGFALQGLRVSLDPGASATPLARLAAELFLATGPGDLARTGLYRATWWSHAALAGALLVAAPFSSLLHALTAPAHLVVASDGPAGVLQPPFDLRELIATGRFELRVGLHTPDDLDRRARLGLLACTRCARCDTVCPAHAAGTALAPSALIRKLRGAATGAVRRDEPPAPLPGAASSGAPGAPRCNQAPLLGGAISGDEVWSCLLCGACTLACPVLLSPAAHVLELRRDVASNGRLDGRRAEALGNLARAGNPYGLPGATRSQVAAELGVAPDPGADTVYWLGCAATYDARVRRVAEAVVAVLRRAGLRFDVLGAAEGCCGDPARRLGEEARFQELALANIETLSRRGVRRIITHCAHCFNGLAHEYPALGGRFEVVHHATFLRELLASGAVAARPPGAPRGAGAAAAAVGAATPVAPCLTGAATPALAAATPVALHDACHVGRFHGAFDAPRALLRAGGARLVELPRSREASPCCGGGGAGYWFDVPRTERPGVARVREALAAGVRTLAVECPFCLRMLEDAATTTAPGDPLAVVDVAEWLAAALEPKEA